MTRTVLVYGATGFSGRAVAAALCYAGHDVIVAGRDAGKVMALARSLNVPGRVFGLNDPAALAEGLAGCKVVLHAAGPYAVTAAAMMAGCVAAGAHYLDLAGEWPVFAVAQELGPAAAAAGVMLMPGVGCMIVASDCLLAHAARRVPGATLLRVASSQPPVVSRGTFQTATGLLSRNVIVRRAGVVRTVPLGSQRRSFNFGDGERQCIGFSWPDVITGQHTTGVANIEAYLEAPPAFRLVWQLGAGFADLCPPAAVDAVLAPLRALWPERPSPDAQAAARIAVVVDAVDEWRRTTRFGLRTLDGYTVTVRTAGAIIARVLAGEHPPGFRTPAEVYGPELIMGLDCAWRYDARVGALADVTS
jgi:short subunit dehydrogenase-like uncharacterized protein